MKKVLMAQAAVCAFILAACQNPDAEQTPNSAEHTSHSDETQSASEPATEASDSADTSLDRPAPSELDRTVEAVIAADDETFMTLIPEGSVYVERSANGIVRVACALDGEHNGWVIRAAQLPDAIRIPFDGAVADELTRGTGPDDDRSQSGFFRRRDGGLGALQTASDAQALCPIAREAHRQVSVLPGHRVPG